MNTPQLLNYEREGGCGRQSGRGFERDPRFARRQQWPRVGSISGRRRATPKRCRRAGAARANLSLVRPHHQGARPRHLGPEGGSVLVHQSNRRGRKDGWIHIAGRAGTLFSFSSKGGRELPDAHVLLDGQLEGLSKNGTFVGPPEVGLGCRARRCTSTRCQLPGVGDAGEARADDPCRVPAIVKPGVGDFLPDGGRSQDHDGGRRLPAPCSRSSVRLGVSAIRWTTLPGRMFVKFTGSAQMVRKTQDTSDRRSGSSVRFVAEQDSLNASLWGPGNRRPRGHSGVRPVHQGSRDRDDRQGRVRPVPPFGEPWPRI